MFRTVVALSMVALAASSCDNGCSGHGVCDCGKCLCYDNWGMGYDLDTGDCSDRICPFEFAWVDTPNIDGKFHRYAECAGRGICNRDSGECECFEGYEGKACARTTCPNDCSGHGTCEYIQNLGQANYPFDGITAEVGEEFTQWPKTFSMWEWDKMKTRGCVCDPEYGDVDCSKRMCNYGNDMMDKRIGYITDPAILATRRLTGSPWTAGEGDFQTQKITFTKTAGVAALASNSFALTFKTKINETFTTGPITVGTSATALAAAVDDALVQLPNRIIDAVTVTATFGTNDIVILVKFDGEYVQGAQNMLVVEDYQCHAGCTPMINGLHLLNDASEYVVEDVKTDYNSFECGRRGKCDYDTGVCECFAGFTGPSCNSCTAMI